MEHIRPWLLLKSVRGIGNLLFKRLIDAFEHPQHVFDAFDQDLLQVEGMTPKLVQSIRKHHLPPELENEIKRLTRSTPPHPFHVITLQDEAYPRLLREIPDPPPLLYVLGNLPLQFAGIALVGSRHATRYGLEAARSLARNLARRGLTVISGLAKGIDTAAHQGALEVNGQTIAVLGSGLNRIYPANNKPLAQRISTSGAVVTEFSMNTQPEPHHFPQRNRIISGLSLGTVVVEAAQRSGSLITARLALEQNREVFAVPGSIHSFKSMGTHALIKQGAKLVEKADDIVEEFMHLLPDQSDSDILPHLPAPQGHPELTAEESKALQSLEPYPIHIDKVVRKLNMPAGKVAGLLLQLELKGLVSQSAGHFFSRKDSDRYHK
jgi:DNA processing protein